MEFKASETPGVGNYNLTNQKHINTPIYFTHKNERRPKKVASKDSDLNVIFKGTFTWIGEQRKQKDSNFFGRSKRSSRNEKKPAPNQYYLNLNWTKKDNLMNITSTSINRSVYYH